MSEPQYRSWFNAAEISFTGIILLQVNLVWSTRPTRAGTWRTTGVLSAAFFADCSNWVMNKMTRLMHKSMLWMSVLLVLFKGLCPSDYKWGICLTFKSWNIFRIHKVLTGYNTIGMFQEQLRVASIFTRCRPLCHALRSADEVLLRFYFALSTLMNQMIRKYCEGYSSSTGLIENIVTISRWCLDLNMSII